MCTYIVGKKNIYLHSLMQNKPEKGVTCLILPVSKACENLFCIFLQYTYIVYIYDVLY